MNMLKWLLSSWRVCVCALQSSGFPPSQLCDDDKLHPETTPPAPSTRTQPSIHKPHTNTNTRSTVTPRTSSPSTPAPQHWPDSCGAARRRCHADRKAFNTGRCVIFIRSAPLACSRRWVGASASNTDLLLRRCGPGFNINATCAR